MSNHANRCKGLVFLLIALVSANLCPAGSIVGSDTACEVSSIPGETFKDCTVLTLGKPTGDKAEVTFKSGGRVHNAVVPCPSSLYNKLKQALEAGSQVDITLNKNGEVTRVQ